MLQPLTRLVLPLHRMQSECRDVMSDLRGLSLSNDERHAMSRMFMFNCYKIKDIPRIKKKSCRNIVR